MPKILENKFIHSYFTYLGHENGQNGQTGDEELLDENHG